MRSTAFCKHPLGMLAVENLLGGAILDAARIAGMPVIDLVGALVAGQHDVAGIDDDDVVAAIHMRREGRFVLASEPLRDQRRQVGRPRGRLASMRIQDFSMSLGVAEKVFMASDLMARRIGASNGLLRQRQAMTKSIREIRPVSYVVQ